MPKTVYLLGLAVAIVASAFLLTDALLWRPGVTEANARRVREGMAVRDVEALFGAPAAKERFGAPIGKQLSADTKYTLVSFFDVDWVVRTQMTTGGRLNLKAAYRRRWQGNGVSATIYFGADDRVIGGLFDAGSSRWSLPATPRAAPYSVLGRLCSLLGL